MLACDAPLSPTSSDGGVEDGELRPAELLPPLDLHDDDPTAAGPDGDGGRLSESALVIVPSDACSPANAAVGSPPWASPAGNNDGHSLGRYRGSTSSVDLMRVASSPVPASAALPHHTSASMSFDRSAAPLCPQLPPGCLLPAVDDVNELASDPVRSTLVAVKVIDFGARDGRNRAPAVAEMAFAARAVAVATSSGDSESHWRHLARIHSVEIDHESASCRVVAEALRGGTLADRVAHEPGDPEAFEEALRLVAVEVLGGLAALHGPLAARHNDLKPDNVMFVHPADAAPCTCVAALRPSHTVRCQRTPDPPPSPSPLPLRSHTRTPPLQSPVLDDGAGVSPATRGGGCPYAPHVKIIDFGSTTLLPLSSGTPPSATLNSNHGDRDATRPPPPPLSPASQRGALGTMSPQRLRGEADDGGGDVWAFGVLLLQVARAGRHPFLDPPAALDCGEMAMPSPSNGTDAASDQFWRLAAVLGALRPATECVEATRRAVDAALDDSCLVRSPALRCLVHAACHADSARRATLNQLQLALRGHGEK